MVQLKGAHTRYQICQWYNFNSFMVQLKEILRRSFNVCVFRFQFLHGTIKRGWFVSIAHGLNRFQFLHGTIKSTRIPGYVIV